MIGGKEGEINLHLESAAADLVSNPRRSVSIGTKMPPPPTPPTVPNPDPKNPITVASTIRQLNFNSYSSKKKKKTSAVHSSCKQ